MGETGEKNTEVPKEDNVEQSVEPVKTEIEEESSNLQKEDSVEMAADPAKIETKEESSEVLKEDCDEMAAEPVKVETEEEGTRVREEDSGEKAEDAFNAVTEESTKVVTVGLKDVDSCNKEESDCINVENSSEMEQTAVKSLVKGEDDVGEVEELVIRSAEDSHPSVDSLDGSIEKAENSVEFDLSATFPANNEGKEELGKDVKEVPKENLGGSVNDKEQCKADSLNLEGSKENKIEGGNTPSGKEVSACDGDRLELEDPIQSEFIVDDK
ncbi:unnamed protein product [Linum trigynum]|uniref:Uncharacterized protein n=1 Tax=Linum trigynum TaxID=586398 RepID=A0AAV2DR73_9ROSI